MVYCSALLRFFDGEPMLPKKSGGDMLRKPDATSSLARFVAATTWEEVPPEVRHQAKRS